MSRFFRTCRTSLARFRYHLRGKGVGGPLGGQYSCATRALARGRVPALGPVDHFGLMPPGSRKRRSLGWKWVKKTKTHSSTYRPAPAGASPSLRRRNPPAPAAAYFFRYRLLLSFGRAWA